MLELHGLLFPQLQIAGGTVLAEVDPNNAHELHHKGPMDLPQ